MPSIKEEISEVTQAISVQEKAERMLCEKTCDLDQELHRSLTTATHVIFSVIGPESGPTNKGEL